MTIQQHKALCGAATRRGHACRNPVPAGGGLCRLHAGLSKTFSSARRTARRATWPVSSSDAEPSPAVSSEEAEAQGALEGDPSRQLQMLQDAALRRALAVYLAEESAVPEDKRDAAFARNVRLAATIARLRLALDKADDAPKSGDDASQAELVVYKLPDNGRE